ncbi:hypothetical protein SODG_005966 [Sodalis praecaptivus]
MMASLIFALDAGIFISVVVRLLTERKEKNGFYCVSFSMNVRSEFTEAYD